MLSLLLPFVVALLLLILLGRMLSQNRGAHADGLFLVLLAAHAFQSVLVGLRWSYGLTGLLPLQAVLAALLAPLAWLCFRGLASRATSEPQLPVWMHGIPAATVLVLVVLCRDAIDPVLIATFLGYGAALAHLARKGPDALGRASFEQALPASCALWATAATLILSGVIETVVSVDIVWGRGGYAAPVVGSAHLLALLVLGAAAAIAGRSQPGHQAEPAEIISAASPDEDDMVVVAKLDAAMATRRLFEDLDLNLERLARKTLIPARRISTAVNRVMVRNVSQYINDHRIAEACRLLAETEESITGVMFKSGFQTKSNFNREFRRVTGTSPSLWRSKRQSQDATADPQSAPSRRMMTQPS
jgi:AraC-like DNA-binding protein